MLPGRKYTPQDVSRILKHRLWLILPPLAVGLAAGMFVFRNIPKVYRSETLIMVIPQRISDAYVKAPVTTKVEDRLASISDQILSRSRLERIILDFDLYREARAKGPMEDVVQRMRTEILPKVEGKESFRISYVSGEPATAQKVTERLASLFIEESVVDRERIADDTNKFLASQLEDAKRRLLEHESKLEEYRRRYAGQLPSQLPSSLQAIQNAQLQLQSITESSNRIRERRLLVERQIADAQTMPVSVISTPGEAPTGQTAAQQLEAAQARLEGLKQKYTDDHPDIRAAQRTVKDLQEKADQEARRPASAVPNRPLNSAESARQKRLSDLRADVEIIDHQLANNQAEEARLKKVMAGYEADVAAVPARESELVELTRDYSTLQATYASLLQKQEDSKLAANLERRQIGEQFKILDPASLPERPFNQTKRLGAIAGGLVGGLALGLLFVAFLEFRDSSYRTEEELQRLLALPVFALVPKVSSERDKRDERRRTIAVRTAGILIFLLGSGAAIVFWRGPF